MIPVHRQRWATYDILHSCRLDLLLTGYVLFVSHLSYSLASSIGFKLSHRCHHCCEFTHSLITEYLKLMQHCQVKVEYKAFIKVKIYTSKTIHK